jgi:hypothetical protein
MCRGSLLRGLSTTREGKNGCVIRKAVLAGSGSSSVSGVGVLL